MIENNDPRERTRHRPFGLRRWLEISPEFFVPIASIVPHEGGAGATCMSTFRNFRGYDFKREQKLNVRIFLDGEEVIYEGQAIVTEATGYQGYCPMTSVTLILTEREGWRASQRSVYDSIGVRLVDYFDKRTRLRSDFVAAVEGIEDFFKAVISLAGSELARAVCLGEIGSRESLEASRAVVSSAGRQFADLIRNFEIAASRIPEADLKLHADHACEMIHPYTVQRADLPFMMFHQPMGHAGGPAEISKLVEGEDVLEGDHISRVIDAVFRHTPMARGHVNRLEMALYLMVEKLRQSGKRPIVGDIFHGPATMLKWAVERHPDVMRQVDIQLVETDQITIDMAQARLELACRNEDIPSPTFRGPVTFAKMHGPAKVIGGQVDCLTALGIDDYLGLMPRGRAFKKRLADRPDRPDRLFVKHLRGRYETLRPGGMLISSNVLKVDGARFLEFVLGDWRLVARPREKLLELANQVVQSGDKVEVFSDTEGQTPPGFDTTRFKSPYGPSPQGRAEWYTKTNALLVITKAS